MSYSNPLEYLAFGDWSDTFVPDFVLAFAFFTALIYAVLGRRLGMQRPAVAASAALGAALSAGLVWWEQANGLSIRDLGPIAVGFAIILLAGVIYQSLRHVGGNWAGAGIALGGCILVGWTLGIDWPVAPEVMQTVAGATLTVGILAFLIHRKGAFGHFPRVSQELTGVRHDMSDLREDREMSNRITDCLGRLRRGAGSLFERPEGADDLMLQLKRILPAEGWLTARMARLRARAHLMRRGYVARIDELREVIDKYSGKTKAKVARELRMRFDELKIGERVERLDKLVAANEKSVRELTRLAQSHLEAHDYQKLFGVLEDAKKTQERCTKLCDLIERTEKKLLATAKSAARQAPEANHT